MPFAERDGVRLYWEEAGSGDPVLLIMGLGMNATGWWRTIPVLADAGLRVLAFDNRGVGRSDRPPGPYLLLVAAGDEFDRRVDRQVDRVQGDFGRDVDRLEGRIRRELDRRLPATPTPP